MAAASLEVLNKLLKSDKEVMTFKGKGPISKRLEELGELEEALKSATSLINSAEKEQIGDERKKKLFDEFKEAVYDADDLIYKITDGFSRKQEGKSRGSIKSQMLRKIFSLSFPFYSREIVAEIVEVTGRLGSLVQTYEESSSSPSDDTRHALNYYRASKDAGTKLPERSLAHVEESDVCGRGADKEAIIELLLSDEKVSAISILGKGGIGKTTLVYLVCNDERISERFHTKAWVMLGDYNIDAVTVMNTIIEKLTSEKCQIEDQYDFEHKLTEALRAKNFLLILDDVCNMERDMWDILSSCFGSGYHGSKIVVTTPSTSVATLMKTGTVHRLESISPEDGRSLFAKHSSINDADIGEEIATKCMGLPLAIKVLAGLLRGEENKKTRNILDNDSIWELYESSNDILPVLWLGYYFLPSHLKPCFAYFALFPKGTKFEKQKMILLWMAEGLLPSSEEKRMEDNGDEYFEDLISRYFLQPTSDDRLAFVMHDLLHELASFVCGEFCFSMDDANLFDCPRKIRHLTYSKGCHHDPWNFEGLSTIKGLRTLLALPVSISNGVIRSSNKQSFIPVEHLISLLSPGAYLRVLSLSEHCMTKLPDSVGDLKYLKYLDLSFTEIEELPETICNLYNLQTLLLEGCTRLTTLPMRIGKLANLRHLHTPPYLQEMPQELGKMTTLQTLSEFAVAANGVKLLNKLRDLHGTLVISRLENVVDDADVIDAKLEEKEFLRELILKWGFSHAADDVNTKSKEKQVLDALKPHANLKKLSIFHYKASSFPNWIGDKSYSTLEEVDLYDCEKCSSLPPLGQLHSLKHLMISDFPCVETIASEFYSICGEEGQEKTESSFRSLESLCFQSMPELKKWSLIEGSIFPCLKELELRDCPNLQVSLSINLPALKKLVIYECDQLLPLLPRPQQMDDAFQSLETIIISECQSQESFLEGGLPSSLKEIVITGCESLAALDEVTFQGLTSLERLEISLCISLECLPKELPTSLSYLRINNCPSLTPRLRRDTGEDWPIIAHIPNIAIRS